MNYLCKDFQNHIVSCGRMRAVSILVEITPDTTLKAFLVVEDLVMRVKLQCLSLSPQKQLTQ